MIVQVILALFLILLTYIYIGGKYNEHYWKKRGVVFHPRNKYLGIFWEFLTSDRAFFQHLQELYDKYPNEPAVATGFLHKPTLLVKDPINIQHALVTDFNSFNGRGLQTNDDDLLAQNLLFLQGQKWKLMRQSMSPLFTSTKLKSMYYIMDKSAKDFVPFIKENPKLMKGDGFNTLSTFCSAAIAAAVFGISTKSIFDSPFLDMAQKSLKSTLSLNLKFILSLACSKILKIFKIKFFGHCENFFIGSIKQIISQRKSENVKKHDFADLCVSLQNKGAIKDVDTGLEVEPTDELLAAQAFFFFNAGVEPTASSMFNALVLLGQHPEVLERLHEIIDNAFEKTQGNITYDTIAEIEYLDMIMNEALRLYSVTGFLGRESVKDTTLPNGNIKVDKGTTIFVPIFSIHRDPQYYPDPEKFIPERFSRENQTPIMEKTFMPFGKGNRNCIGMRYAQLQAKAGMIHLLRHYTVKTIVEKGKKIDYNKEFTLMRLKNVDIEFVERDVKLY